LASSTLGNNSSEPQFRKNNNTYSANKNKIIGRGRKGDEKEEEKEENITSHKSLIYSK